VSLNVTAHSPLAFESSALSSPAIQGSSREDSAGIGVSGSHGCRNEGVEGRSSKYLEVMQQQMHEKMDRNMSTLAHEVGSFVSHELGGIWQVFQQSVFPLMSSDHSNTSLNSSSTSELE